MPISQQTQMQSIDAFLQAEIAKKKKALINTLKYVGESCINEARSNGDYMDQTGNLRSSIGYIIFDSGNIVKTGGFSQTKSGNEGQKKGKDFANELVSSGGIGLIVVAGMKYAAYVETKRNVLTSAELLAERLVPDLLRQLGFAKIQ